MSINAYRQAVGCLQELGWFIAEPKKFESTIKLAALAGGFLKTIFVFIQSP